MSGEYEISKGKNLPTMLQKGTIVPSKNVPLDEKERIKKITAISFILDNFFDARISLKKGVPPRIKSTKVIDKILVLLSGTGSGKSTAFIEALFDRYFPQLHKSIAITEPKILTVKEIPYDIIKRRKDLELGVTIGYQTGVISKRPLRGIHFMTTGVLVQQFKTYTDEEIRNKYFVIVIDEVHIRDTYIDLLMMYIESFLSRNWEESDCPFFVLMSATLNPITYLKYFGLPASEYKKTPNLITVEGKGFPIEEHWPKIDIANYITYIFDLVKRIHNENQGELDSQIPFDYAYKNKNSQKKNVDILIFVPTLGVIKEIISLLNGFNDEIAGITAPVKQLINQKTDNQTNLKKGGRSYPVYDEWSDDESVIDESVIDKSVNGGIVSDNLVKVGKSKGRKPLFVCPIILNSESFSKMGEDYLNLFSDISTINVTLSNGKKVTPSRRVIVATNVAETGITLETLQYVIISGWANAVEYLPFAGLSLLSVRPITQSEVKQQRGRVGRNHSGHAYFCFTKDTFDKMEEIQYPAVLRTEAASNLLDIIILQTESKLDKEMITHQILDPRKSSSDLSDLYNLSNKSDSKIVKSDKNDQKLDQRSVIVQERDFDITKTKLITYPSMSNLNSSFEKLHLLGFITHNMNPTFSGLLSVNLKKIKLENIRMIFSGYTTGCCILDLITIAAFVENGRHILDFRKEYKPRNIFNLSDKESALNYRLLVQDDFIEYVFIWNAFIDQIDQTQIKVTKVKKWCMDNNLNYTSLLTIGGIRNEIIETLTTIGLNSYHSGLDLPLGMYNLNDIIARNVKDGMAEVVKLKKSIYEGYKLNICTYNEYDKCYILDKGQISVQIFSKLITPLPATGHIQQTNPKKIIVANVILKTSPAYKGYYKYESSGPCMVIDGFFSYDKSFFEMV